MTTRVRNFVILIVCKVKLEEEGKMKHLQKIDISFFSVAKNVDDLSKCKT